ncbi:MAG: DinB family protein [Phycisphaeraceae bacterium]|nr:DinB family protein [Phycisphaeraceae bacterium]
MPIDTLFEQITGLSHAELIDRYAMGVERFDARVLKLDDAALDTAFLTGTEVTMPDGTRGPLGIWPVRVLLGHLADAEIVLVHRMRRVVAEDRPVLAYWDENAFIDAGLYAGPGRPIAAFVATVHTLRKWTTEWLRTLSDQQWARIGLHTQNGEQSVRTIANYATWHLEHHAIYLNRKVERLSKS